MPHIQIRLKAGVDSPGDLRAMIQDNTFEYLMNSPAPEIRVSAYLDQEWPMVEPKYAEIVVDPACTYQSRITKVIPGSKTRKAPTLPGPMHEGEQLVLMIARIPLE